MRRKQTEKRRNKELDITETSRRKRKQNELEDEDIPKSVLKMKRKNLIEEDDEEFEEELPKKRRKNIDRKPKKKSKLKKLIKIIIIIIILIQATRLLISTLRWKKLATDMLSSSFSIVLDQEGNEIAKIGDSKIKTTITSEEIPENLKNAYIAIEDERYYKHHGVDAKRTIAATGSYIIHFGKSSFGGSTITQQLVKNMTEDSDSSISRKVKEWWKAWNLDSCGSKDEILTSYLNTIYVGPNIYGVEAGAQYYFSKSASDLTLEECAFLAGINHSPNSYNPYSEADNQEKIKTRTKTVLNKLKELDMITNEQYETAKTNVENGLNFQKSIENQGNGVYSYHTDQVIKEATQDIAKKYKITTQLAENYLELSGSTIYSTQIAGIQETIENEFEKEKYQMSSKTGGNPSQAAMVVIDHTTGEVLGCVGGLGEKTEVRPLNRATQSVRQTGSSIKPLAVVAPAIDKKIITASSIVDDTERDFEGGYHPIDYTSPLGLITVRRAIESSQNVPFVEIMKKLTPKTSIKYLEKMGITSLTENDESLALALGGEDKGISPLEMCGAYATIANGGVYKTPIFYTKIERNNGKNLIRKKQKTKRVFSEEVAYIMQELLLQPTEGEHGTAKYCAINGIDVATKTGTTDDNYDRWLCGFTPYYTTVCWYGYDQNESINYNNRNPSGLLWANVMSRIHTGLEGKEFEKPSKVIEAVVCSETGEKATTGCESTYTEYFLKGTEPQTCSKHAGTTLQTTNNSQTKSNTKIEAPTNDITAPEEESRFTIIDNTTKNTTNTITNTQIPTQTQSQNQTQNTITSPQTTPSQSSTTPQETPIPSTTQDTQSREEETNTETTD